MQSRQKVKLNGILLRPQVNIQDLVENVVELKEYTQNIDSDIRGHIVEQAEILMKYEGYIEKSSTLWWNLSVWRMYIWKTILIIWIFLRFQWRLARIKQN